MGVNAGKSTKIALGGVCSALCLAFMFFTGLIPFSTYALPAFAGMFLIVVEYELGFGAAITVYIATSLLSLFIVPDKESAVLFIILLGYYPVIKPKIDMIGKKVICLLVKIIMFNVIVIGSYYLAVKFLKLESLVDSSLGRAAIPITIILANITFIIYDFTLKNITLFYINSFRDKIIKKGHR